MKDQSSSEDAGSVVTISFFRYRGAAKWWGIQQMQVARKRIAPLPGLQFYKLLGSGGGNGFSVWPDFSRYGLLCVWNGLPAARSFFDQSRVFTDFRHHAEEHWTVFMRTIRSHGQWSGACPFQPDKRADAKGLMGVITRATLKKKHLWNFWRHVPRVSESLSEHEGLLFSAGIGELPLVQQATFSLWTDRQAMINYAYRSRYHREVVQKTRELGWYAEEMFAQFKPFRTEGSWEGGNPLGMYLEG
jgi:hypothetical protein